VGHFETKSDACRCASLGLILLQELTFWRSASKIGAYVAIVRSTARLGVDRHGRSLVLVARVAGLPE